MKNSKDMKQQSKNQNFSVKFPEGKYFYGLGRRKASVAQVRVYESGKGKIFINNIPMNEYISTNTLQEKIISPLKLVAKENLVDVYCKIIGGGITGQAEAARLGISIALTKLDPEFRTSLKKMGFLTRDPRVVERKKPGKKKARRAPQWAKR